MSAREQIQSRLQSLSPQHLEIVDESDRHNVPKGAQSHFKVVLVSEEFEGTRLLERHRRVNALLADLLASQIHALALHTFTPGEWQKKTASDSPPCLGGSKD